MPSAGRRRLVLILLLIVGAAAFLPGINWGLPSPAADAFLFGERPPWTGAEILALAPAERDPGVAADVDVTPITQDRDRPIPLNATDEQRAEIVRRYRLFSFQPDEMITFSALAEMNPRQLRFDPKLYQYGGMWVYPVGALLQVGSVVGAVQLRGDPAFYLDHPEAFGRFYVVARLYTVAWGLLGVWAVFWIAGRASGSLLAATAAALTYIALPVVVNMAHEAKPHLPGAVLMLCAVIAATRFVETGFTRWWVAAAVLCGAATGMVLSAAIIVVILPIMVLLRAEPRARRATIISAGGLIAAAVYLLTNPYVLINLLINRALLRSNFENTAAMYPVGRFGDGFFNAMRLIAEGSSLGVAMLGAVAVVALLVRAAVTRRPAAPLAWLLGVPAVIVVAQLVAVGAGKPAEYGRFALLPDIAIIILVTTAVVVFSRRTTEQAIVLTLLFVMAAIPGSFYLLGFVRDASDRPRRYDDARWLAMLQGAGGRSLGVIAEPAPYSLPPVDLFEWDLTLLPQGFDIEHDVADADVIVRAVDELGPNGATAGPYIRASVIDIVDVLPPRISWAAKPFEVWVRTELMDAVQP